MGVIILLRQSNGEEFRKRSEIGTFPTFCMESSVATVVCKYQRIWTIDSGVLLYTVFPLPRVSTICPDSWFISRLCVDTVEPSPAQDGLSPPSWSVCACHGYPMKFVQKGTKYENWNISSWHEDGYSVRILIPGRCNCTVLPLDAEILTWSLGHSTSLIQFLKGPITEPRSTLALSCLPSQGRSNQTSRAILLQTSLKQRGVCILWLYVSVLVMYVSRYT